MDALQIDQAGGHGDYTCKKKMTLGWSRVPKSLSGGHQRVKGKDIIPNPEKRTADAEIPALNFN